MYLKKKLGGTLKLAGILLGTISLISCSAVDDEVSTENSMFAGFYNQDEYLISGKHVLNSDLIVKSKKIIFLPDSEIKLNNFDLKLYSETIEFNNAKIYSYETYDHGACENDGFNGGNLFVYSEYILGSPTIGLKGQNAGRNGWAYDIRENDNKYFHPDDIKLTNKKDLNFVIHPCQYSQKFTRDTWFEYWIYKTTNAGQPGTAFIYNKTNIENFFPKFIYEIGKGDYTNIVSFSTGNVSWRQKSPRGQNSRTMQTCFIDEKEFVICDGDFEYLKQKIMK